MPGHRYHLAAQYDWQGRHGFYLSFENETPEPTCRLNKLRLTLGVAHGNRWRFIVGSPQREWNTTYTPEGTDRRSGGFLVAER